MTGGRFRNQGPNQVAPDRVEWTGGGYYGFAIKVYFDALSRSSHFIVVDNSDGGLFDVCKTG